MRRKMKIAGVVLTVVSLIFAFLAYKLNRPPQSVLVRTSELEQNVKELSSSLENAKAEEKNGDQQLQDAIDKEVSRTVVDPRSAEKLKSTLKTRASETSTMPALEDAANKSKSIETSVEDLKNKTPSPTRGTSWIDYNPKLLFSLILLGASLWVILSGKYSEPTEKWAFAMISLIAGVWIGTATS